MEKYKCLENYYNFDNVLCFKEDEFYYFKKINSRTFTTEKNHQGYAHELGKEDILLYFMPITKEEPNHYDNSKGSLYQFCENQQLNSYEFDIIKRVMRCRKKGNFKEDLEKTKFLIDLYLKEYEVK